jgi:hypothetical protein
MDMHVSIDLSTIHGGMLCFIDMCMYDETRTIIAQLTIQATCKTQGFHDRLHWVSITMDFSIKAKSKIH